MGRLDRTVLSIRSARSVKKSLVYLWMSFSRRRNAQRAALIRHAFFPLLAVVAKKMDARISRTDRFCFNSGAACFAMAPVQSGCMDYGRDCGQR